MYFYQNKKEDAIPPNHKWIGYPCDIYMSEYNCFNCNKTEHTSELVRVEWRGLISLLCKDCVEKIFVNKEEEENVR